MAENPPLGARANHRVYGTLATVPDGDHNRSFPASDGFLRDA